jgi:predicted DNA-binding helix-hairpin-helix protein
VDEIRHTQPDHLGWKGHWPSSVTQFVAGGSGESDLELLTTTEWLHRNLHLKRAYFSAFNPIQDTPLENQPATPPLREHRLYQASFLLRDYAFDVEDLPFDQSGNLPMQADPKLAWAREHLSQAPVELNHADRHILLRVPGIGPKGAEAILRSRKEQKLRQLSGLRQLGIHPERAAPFILLDGKRAEFQLALF